MSGTAYCLYQYTLAKVQKATQILELYDITNSLGRVMTLRRSYQMRLEPAKCFCV